MGLKVRGIFSRISSISIDLIDVGYMFSCIRCGVIFVFKLCLGVLLLGLALLSIPIVGVLLVVDFVQFFLLDSGVSLVRIFIEMLDRRIVTTLDKIFGIDRTIY